MTSLRWIFEHELATLAIASVAAFAVGLLGLKLTFRPSFKPRPLLTDNEREFHRRIRAALPDFDVWPQVAMLALIEPKSRQGSYPWKRAFSLISNRRVDWVIARQGNPVLVIELDDRTHNAKRDKKRDQILSSCQIHVLRYKSHQKPSVDEIRHDVFKGISD